MPRGLVRYHHTGNFHFLTFSRFHRLPYLGSAEACDLFLDGLERTRLRYRFVVAGYVVMPEHVHMLVGEPQKGDVSALTHALKLSTSMRRTERPFWQARYYDFLVHNDEKRIEKLRYMHRNPVVRSLAKKPKDWP
jgi:putative transposase